MKPQMISIFLLCIFILLPGFTAAQNTVTLLHTNDMHAQYVPLPATWVQQTPKPMIGGMVALDYFVRRQLEQHPEALVLDAGDISTGTPLSKIEYKGALNGGFVEMMNLMDYDAYTIGNHEFDEGTENLKLLLDLMTFDVLGANLRINGENPADAPFKIYNVGDVRVGVIGLILENLAGVVGSKNLAGVEILKPAQTAQAIIDEIDPQTDLIVVLTHQGRDEDLDLAEQLFGADIIIGGHSHTRLTRAIERNGILVVQAGSKTRNLGRLTVDVQADTIADFEYKLIDTWVDSVKNPNPEIAALVDTFQKEIDAEYNKQIGTLQVDWRQNSRGESNLGNFLADVMRYKTDTDMAIINSGGIRKSLPAGPITKLDIAEILPFSNYVVTFELTGEQIMKLVRENVEAALTGAYGVSQISGLNYTYRVKDDTAEVVEVTVNGAPLEGDKTYSCATVDYLYGQLTERYGYDFTNLQQTPQLISTMVVEYLKLHPVVDTKVEGRIKKIK